jgi:drug/metabolite transporter (DMT)-like permease
MQLKQANRLVDIFRASTKEKSTIGANDLDSGTLALSGRRLRSRGILAALGSALFLGMMPIFGKQAILMGMPPLAVVSMRTSFAALLLFVVVFVFFRRYVYIYPAGLAGCLIAGAINGFGSLFYYSALARVDASIGHLLYTLYPLFLAIWLILDRQPPSRITWLRICLAIPAVYLLTQASGNSIDWLGVIQMLIAAALYALHLPINQRVLYDMPAPTVTLYTLIAMSIVVVPAFLLFGTKPEIVNPAILNPLLGLTLATFLSRLMLFIGVKHLGGMQTALLGLGEMFVVVFSAYFWLGEQLTLHQWMGVILLTISMVLMNFDKSPAWRNHTSVWLGWLKPPGLSNNYPWQSSK